MSWKKSIFLIILASLMVLPIIGCPKPGQTVPSASALPHPKGWTKATHSDNVDPNYEIVFPQNKVNQIKITITPEDWNAMQADMTELLGVPGTRQPIGQIGGGIRPDGGVRAPGAAPAAQGIPGWIDTAQNPMWVSATIEFKGLVWDHVGVRYKGNSSLMSGWNSGAQKLPLKLDFDQFESQHPEIENQRFYGFKQLTLSNAFTDSTYMHDVIAAYLLAEAGLPAAKTAYYEIVLDHGEGPVELGLYVMIEAIDDTAVDRIFGEDSGNIYEGDGRGVSLAEGTFSQIQASFPKENNSGSNWSDIEALYNVLHATERTLDPAAWRKSLGLVFNVNDFLEWLSIAAIIQHWDTYGSMTHNFYLYHDPDTGLLNWISWDHNQVLAGAAGVGPGGMRAPVGGLNRSVSLGREEIGQNWPLIRYLLDDPVYHEFYIDYLDKTINGVFNPDKLKAKCQELAKLIAPYVTRNSTEASFQFSVQELMNRIDERYQAAAAFLASERR
jgi:spore coat protein H